MCLGPDIGLNIPTHQRRSPPAAFRFPRGEAFREMIVIKQHSSIDAYSS
jgi:hypothetical protein